MIEKVNIKTEFIKADSFLKLCGACKTGGEGKIAILAGMVKVNGEECTMRGKKLYNGDIVSYKGKEYEVCC